LKEENAMKKKIVFIFVALALVLAACGVKAAATPSVELVSPGSRAPSH
jgi:flagellar basal body-associated protein FliL